MRGTFQTAKQLQQVAGKEKKTAGTSGHRGCITVGAFIPVRGQLGRMEVTVTWKGDSGGARAG